MSILKYLVFAVILALLLNYMPNLTVSNDTKMQLGLIIFTIVILLDIMFYRSKEHMSPYFYTSVASRMKDDYGNTGLIYNNDLPYQNVIGPDHIGTVDYNDADELINKSVANDLYNQHNFNVMWSPHTHVGKGRAYLNWDEQPV